MKTQKKTAIEYFQSGEPKVIRHLEIRLQDLLTRYKTPYSGIMNEYSDPLKFVFFQGSL